LGETQLNHALPSSRHSKSPRGSSLERSKRAVRALVDDAGPRSMRVCGAVAATVHDRVAGEASTPLLSLARTAKVCAPSARPVYVFGPVHAAQLPASRRHSKVAPAADAENAKVASREVTGELGPLPITVSIPPGA